MEARRQLEQKAAEARPEQVGDEPEILDQRGGARKSPGVRDELVDLYRVRKAPAPDLTVPRGDGSECRPRVKGRVELDRPERARVMFESAAARMAFRIEAVAPMPVEPARAADMDVLFGSARSDRPDLAAWRRVAFVLDSRFVHFARADDVLCALLRAPFLTFR